MKQSSAPVSGMASTSRPSMVPGTLRSRISWGFKSGLFVIDRGVLFGAVVSALSWVPLPCSSRCAMNLRRFSTSPAGSFCVFGGGTTSPVLTCQSRTTAVRPLATGGQRSSGGFMSAIRRCTREAAGSVVRLCGAIIASDPDIAGRPAAESPSVLLPFLSLSQLSRASGVTERRIPRTRSLAAATAALH
jgi:hypothetical protein